MKSPAVYLRSSVIISYSSLFDEQMAADVSPLRDLLPLAQIASSFYPTQRERKKNWEKMFQCLCLTGKINCTYKIQITLFNLKMIGPGLSPRAWSVGWCMALVYSSTANPTVLCRPPGQSWEGRDVHTVMEPEDVLMFYKPPFLTLDFNLEIWGCTCWKRRIISWC